MLVQSRKLNSQRASKDRTAVILPIVDPSECALTLHLDDSEFLFLKPSIAEVEELISELQQLRRNLQRQDRKVIYLGKTK